MKKLYLLVILCLISSSAHAAWTKVWESDASQYFIQSETVKYKNQLANFWLLTNHNLPDESGYLSYKQKIEMDCGYSQLRLIAQIGYEKKNGWEDPITFVRLMKSGKKFFLIVLAVNFIDTFA